MEFSYVAYNKERKLVKGKLSASNDGAAGNLLESSGYRVLSLKAQSGLLNSEKLNMTLGNVNPKEIIMFSRQMALLLDSGTDIVVSLELLQTQVANKELKKKLGEVAADIRGGSSLSNAMRKHPRVFPALYWRAISAGEKSGNMELVMRQMADYMEKRMITEKKIRGALSYPIFVVITAVGVVAVLVNFVMPSFSSLYGAFGAKLPTLPRLMMDGSAWLKSNSLFILIGFVSLGVSMYALAKTPRGKYQLDKTMLRMPIIGRITNLNELSRLCRTMALLFKVGLSLPDIMALSVQNTGNKIVAKSVAGVQQDLIRGEGLSKPMAKRSFFLPLMVQMVAVGEETGNLDNTLATVAETYEVEADDRTAAAVGLITPIMTIVIGGMIALIAVTMVSAMYGLYGQIG
ncbi:MAG: type II secretion system F family protein [Dehalococcoidia bacterium]|nr:MAG: type II secretion system F family protein [Dehalococcoidia bacterium]